MLKCERAMMMVILESNRDLVGILQSRVTAFQIFSFCLGRPSARETGRQ